MSKVEKLNTENLELREKLIEYERDNCVVNSKVADFEKKIEQLRKLNSIQKQEITQNNAILGKRGIGEKRVTIANMKPPAYGTKSTMSKKKIGINGTVKDKSSI